MRTTYFGIFANGDHIEDISLSKVAAIDDVIYILRKEAESDIGCVTYTLIDKDGNVYDLRIGHFGVLHIGADGKWAGSNQRDIKIKDTRLNKIHTFKATATGVKFFYDELIPLLEKLSEIGSWEMYEKLTELENLRVDNAQLKLEVRRLNSVIS